MATPIVGVTARSAEIGEGQSGTFDIRLENPDDHDGSLVIALVIITQSGGYVGSFSDSGQQQVVALLSGHRSNSLTQTVRTRTRAGHQGNGTITATVLSSPPDYVASAANPSAVVSVLDTEPSLSGTANAIGIGSSRPRLGSSYLNARPEQVGVGSSRPFSDPLPYGRTERVEVGVSGARATYRLSADAQAQGVGIDSSMPTMEVSSFTADRVYLGAVRMPLWSDHEALRREHEALVEAVEHLRVSLTNHDRRLIYARPQKVVAKSSRPTLDTS